MPLTSGGARNANSDWYIADQHADVERCKITGFAARRHASAIYAAVVCLFVYLSQVGVLLKRLNLGSRKQRYTIAQGLWFSDAVDFGKTRTGLSLAPTEAPNADGVGKNWRRSTTRCNSKTSTVASVVDLVRSQVYRAERPRLFAARLP